jgi:hypothetical protein
MTSRRIKTLIAHIREYFKYKEHGRFHFYTEPGYNYNLFVPSAYLYTSEKPIENKTHLLEFGPRIYVLNHEYIEELYEEFKKELMSKSWTFSQPMEGLIQLVHFKFSMDTHVYNMVFCPKFDSIKFEPWDDEDVDQRQMVFLMNEILGEDNKIIVDLMKKKIPSLIKVDLAEQCLDEDAYSWRDYI